MVKEKVLNVQKTPSPSSFARKGPLQGVGFRVSEFVRVVAIANGKR
jgi:hypothetical protein